MNSPYRIELLKRQDRSTFDCGTEVLNVYLKKQARREQRKNYSTCYLALNSSDEVVGFYTLSSSSIDLDELPNDVRKKLPRYRDVPVARIGRLAVDNEYHGQGLGGALVADAIKRIVFSGIGCFAVVVDAKDGDAISFYRHLGFDSLKDKDDVLYLSIATAKKSVPTN